MKIVIDIDENVFTRLFDNGTEDYEIVNDDLFAIAKSIRNGTPLPEHHGRLIDADAIKYTHTIARSLDDGHNWNELCVTKDELYDAPTIIEGSDSK